MERCTRSEELCPHPQKTSKMRYTWMMATMHKSLSMVNTKELSSITTLARNDNRTNPHATLGLHQQANHNHNHSTSPRGIFTGLALTQLFLDKLSPRSKSAAMQNFVKADDMTNFSTTDDCIYNQRLKRRKTISILLLALVALASMIFLASSPVCQNVIAVESLSKRSTTMSVKLSSSLSPATSLI